MSDFIGHLHRLSVNPSADGENICLGRGVRRKTGSEERKGGGGGGEGKILQDNKHNNEKVKYVGSEMEKCFEAAGVTVLLTGCWTRTERPPSVIDAFS